MEKYRAKFLIETVTDLQANLNKLNIPLFIYKKTPEDILPLLIKDYAITSIYFQEEWTTEEIKVVQNLQSTEKGKHLNWISSFDQFLFHPEDIPFTIKNIPQVFTNFRKKCEKYVSVRPEYNISPLPLENKIDNVKNVPTLQELGFESFEVDSRTAFPFEGGENMALKRIEEYFWNTHALSYYKKTRNGLIGKNYSSKLSAWLANGSISPRTIYHEVKRYEQEVLKNDATYWLIFELLWRVFFK